MLPYFPFDDTHPAFTLGTRALGNAPIIRIEPQCYHSEVALKAAILAADQRFHCQALPETLALQWDLVALVLPDLVRHYPEHFALHTDGDRWQWHNRLLDSATTFAFGDPATLPLAPLDWLGRQVQEDLLVCTAAAGFPLVAGQLCFANNWCLDDKLGKPLLVVHHEVPGFAAQLGHQTTLLFERFKSGRPVWRSNWSIMVTDALNLAPQINAQFAPLKATITADNAGQRCTVRVEHQVLARLERTGGVLFTVHTYQSPLATVVDTPERARTLHNVLHTAPEAVLAYKGIAPFAAPLLAYLEQVGSSSSNR